MLGDWHFIEMPCQGRRPIDALLEGDLPLQAVLAAATNAGRIRGSVSELNQHPLPRFGGSTFRLIVSYARQTQSGPTSTITVALRPEGPKIAESPSNPRPRGRSRSPQPHVRLPALVGHSVGISEGSASRASAKPPASPNTAACTRPTRSRRRKERRAPPGLLLPSGRRDRPRQARRRSRPRATQAARSASPGSGTVAGRSSHPRRERPGRW